MRSKRHVVHGSLLLSTLLTLAPVSAGEWVCPVPIDEPDLDCLYLLLAKITEEPDPITMASPSREIASAAKGSAGVYEDIEPQIATGGGLTVAVWADTAEGEGDIVFSEWRPGGWRQTYLTHGGVDDRDPRVDVGVDGTVWVAWWEREAPRQVRVARRDPVTLRWEQPTAFAGLFGSRPAVVVTDDAVLVGFERRVWSGGHEVVVRRIDESGGSSDTVLAATPRETPLFIELHDGARTFIDWIHSDGFYGYSEYTNGRWGVSLDTRPLSQRAHPERRGVQQLHP